MINALLEPAALAAMGTALAVFLTVLGLVIPMFGNDKLEDRMKSVALEREQLRARERARLQEEKNTQRNSSRKKEANSSVKGLVEALNLRTALADEATEEKLLHAGLRGQGPLMVFLLARFILPFVGAALGALYVFVLSD
ncbi:type II secretion system F family protein, partial [Rhizobiaceae bacterium]|nr:type II secretion system F family protein [Rhizobiaceae bacterium]